MRWKIILLLLILVLAGCTREIIRENTIIKDSTPALEDRIDDLKQKVNDLETKLAEYESSMNSDSQGVVIQQEIQATQVQSQQIQKTVEIPPAPLNTTVVIPVLNPDTIIVETNKSLQERARISELLEKADARVKSYSFIYAFSQTPLSGSTFYLKGDKIKIKLKSVGTYNFEDYFDTVYLDITNRTARGYCEDTTLEACRKGVNEYNLSYDNYRIKTPSDWLEDLRAARFELEFKGDVILFERSTILLQKNNTLFWIDDFSGLPLRIKIQKNVFEEIHDFRHLSLNYLSDRDVVKN